MSHLGESPGILVQIASREKLDNNLLLVSTSSHADKIFFCSRESENKQDENERFQ